MLRTKSKPKLKRTEAPKAQISIFGKLQTNRVSLRKYIEFFKHNKQGSELLISPRPKPGGFQEFYFALFRFPAETKNKAYVTGLKNFKALSEKEYAKEIESIEFYWET